MPMAQQCLPIDEAARVWPSPYAWWVLYIVLSMHTEDAEHEKAGAVRKVASEPQGLHALQGKEPNGLQRSETNGDPRKPGGALALPPSVYAAMHTIEEAHTEQCEGTDGEGLPGPIMRSKSDHQGWLLDGLPSSSSSQIE